MGTALHANFRMVGWRWPFRPGDILEVWRDDQLAGELSVELLTSIIVHYLVSHDLVRRFDAAMTLAAVQPARPLLTTRARGTMQPGPAILDADHRAALRARRRARNLTRRSGRR